MALSDDNEQIQQRAAAWREKADAASKRKSSYKTLSQLPVEPVYGPADVTDSDYLRDVGLPGEYPYLRGVHPTGYRSRLWTMRMFAGFGQPRETNERFRFLMDQGETGLSVAFDMPTLYGYDHDDERARGEFGKCGVAVSCLEDMQTVFDTIPLDQVTTSMTIKQPGGHHLGHVHRRRRASGRVNGIAGAAPSRTTFSKSISPRTSTSSRRTHPCGWWSIRLNSPPNICPGSIPSASAATTSREAGSNAVQELAFTLVDGFEYVRHCVERGLAVDDFAPRLSFFFNVHNDFFEEIAKFRSARRIWAREMRETFGAGERAFRLAAFPRPDFRRVADSAAAGEQRGAGVSAGPWPRCWAAASRCTPTARTKPGPCRPPRPPSKRCAPSRLSPTKPAVVDTVDPLGGSYYVETLTNQVEAGAYDYFERIDRQGGVIPALESGFFQREIADAA